VVKRIHTNILLKLESLIGKRITFSDIEMEFSTLFFRCNANHFIRQSIPKQEIFLFSLRTFSKTGLAASYIKNNITSQICNRE